MKKLRFVFYFVCFACLLMVPASAYVDPSVSSMLIQGIVGVVVAVAAVAGVLWRRAKKKAQEVLHIDENAGKTVEEDVVAFDETAQAAIETAEASVEAVEAAVEETVTEA